MKSSKKKVPKKKLAKIKGASKAAPDRTASKKKIAKSGTLRKQAHATSRNRRNQAKQDSKG